MDAASLDGRDDDVTDHDGHGAGQDGDRRRSWPPAAGLIGVLAALFAVLWLLSLTGSGESRGAGPVDEHRFEAPTTTSPVREPEGALEVASETGEPTSAPSTEPFSAMEGRLVYLSGSHVVLLDLATGALRRLPIEAWGSLLDLADYELLTDAKRTVGLSLEADPPSALLVASGAELVPSTQPLVDFWVISRPDGPGGAIRFNAWQNYGVLTGELQAPPGTEVMVVRDAGVLVAPPVGRTFRPTFAGFEVVSEHRLLAASGQLRVEQRCDERLSCGVVAVNAATGQATELPEEFVAELAAISVSPDGRWLLNDTSPAWLFDRQTARVRLLDGGGYGQPQWSEDSTSVAWLTSDRTPTLVVAQLEPTGTDDDWLVVELTGLGVDPSPGSSFLLSATFSSR